jgi:RNA-directed DNA polymerase
MRKAIAERLQTCGLELHPEKTKIVYCKDDFRKRKNYPNEKFDFLGPFSLGVPQSRTKQRRRFATLFGTGTCLTAATRRLKVRVCATHLVKPQSPW